MEKTELEDTFTKILELKEATGVLFFDKDGDILAYKTKAPIVPEAVVTRKVIDTTEMLHELAHSMVKYLGPLELMVFSYKNRKAFVFLLKEEIFFVLSTKGDPMNPDLIKRVRKILP